MSFLCRSRVAFLRLWIESDSLCCVKLVQENLSLTSYFTESHSHFFCVHKDSECFIHNPLPHNALLSYTTSNWPHNMAKRVFEIHIPPNRHFLRLRADISPSQKSLSPWGADTAWDTFLLYFLFLDPKIRQCVAMATITSC